MHLSATLALTSVLDSKEMGRFNLVIFHHQQVEISHLQSTGRLRSNARQLHDSVIRQQMLESYLRYLQIVFDTSYRMLLPSHRLFYTFSSLACTQKWLVAQLQQLDRALLIRSFNPLLIHECMSILARTSYRSHRTSRTDSSPTARCTVRAHVRGRSSS